MWIDFFSQEIKRKILLTSKSVNFWWDKNRKITFWVYHLHPALCASPPQIPILPQSNLPKRCYETHCIGNMHMVTYQTYLDAERPRKLPPPCSNVVHIWSYNPAPPLPRFATLFLWLLVWLCWFTSKYYRPVLVKPWWLKARSTILCVLCNML